VPVGGSFENCGGRSVTWVMRGVGSRGGGGRLGGRTAAWGRRRDRVCYTQKKRKKMEGSLEGLGSRGRKSNGISPRESAKNKDFGRVRAGGGGALVRLTQVSRPD